MAPHNTPGDRVRARVLAARAWNQTDPTLTRALYGGDLGPERLWVEATADPDLWAVRCHPINAGLAFGDLVRIVGETDDQFGEAVPA